MDAFLTKFFRDAENPVALTGVAGCTVQSIHADNYEGVVITFTNGSRLVIEEKSQTGELGICQLEADAHPLSDWQYEVENGDTRLGYDAWLANKQEGDA